MGWQRLVSGHKSHQTVVAEPHDVYIELYPAVHCDIHVHAHAFCMCPLIEGIANILLSLRILHHLSMSHTGTVILDLNWTLCLYMNM